MPDHKNRAHALLSASSAHRWLACPPSAVAAELYPAQDTEFTREGTLAHEVAEGVAKAALNGEARELFWDDPDKGITHEMIEHAEGYADYIQEHTKSVRAITLLEQRVDFSPWVPDGFGTCDCIIIQDTTLTVIDYKYGKGVAVEAKDNPQMKLYALGALNDYGFAYDIEQIEMHIYQPRINNISTDSLTADALMAWAEEIKPVAAAAAQGGGEYEAGPQCRFCPHAGRCKKLTEVCTEYVQHHGIALAVPVLAPHEVAEVLQMEPMVSLWLKRVKDQAMTAMLNGEQIPGYKVVEGKMGNRKWTDELLVAQTLDAYDYSREDYTETKLLSPAAMDKALGKKKVAELLGTMIDRAPGSPTIAPENDKRPAYNRTEELRNDFT